MDRLEALVLDLVLFVAAAPRHPSVWDRLLRGRTAAGARRFTLTARVACHVLTTVYAATPVTLRDVFYHFAELAQRDQAATDAAVMAVATAIGLPRHSMLVSAATRGSFVGRVAVDGVVATAPRCIPGDWAQLLDFITVFASASDEQRMAWSAKGAGPRGACPVASAAFAEYLDCGRRSGDVHLPTTLELVGGASTLVIVEKDSVFQRLVDTDAVRRLPCVLVTGRGVPDVATRCFVKLATLLYPSLRVAALVDFNPAGVVIALQYRAGPATRSAVGSAATAVAHLEWLGLHADDAREVPSRLRCAFTPRDRALCATLRRRAPPSWRAGVDAMSSASFSVDLEALYATALPAYADMTSVLARLLATSRAGDDATPATHSSR